MDTWCINMWQQQYKDCIGAEFLYTMAAKAVIIVNRLFKIEEVKYNPQDSL